MADAPDDPRHEVLARQAHVLRAGLAPGARGQRLGAHGLEVVLDAEVHARAAADSRALLSSVVDDYRAVELGAAGEVVARWEAPWGDEAELRIADDARELVWGDATSQSFVPTPALPPGGAAPADPLMIVQLGAEQVDVPLEWSGRISGPDVWWRLLRPLREWGILAE